MGAHLVEALVARGYRVRVLVREPGGTVARWTASAQRQVAAGQAAHAERPASAGRRARVRPAADAERAARLERMERLGVEPADGGLEDEPALRRAVEGVDVVHHLAAVTSAVDEAGYLRVNEAGTRRLVEAILGATRRPRRLVYLSSLAAAGPAVAGRPVGPTDPPRPLTAYGRSKRAGETVCLAARDELEVVVLRAPAVYGPGDRELLRFFRLAALGVLPIPTGPARPLQLVHVRDLADALVRVGEAEVEGVFHVAEPRSYEWTEVTRLVARAVGRRAVRLPVPAPALRGAAALSEWMAWLGGRTTVFNRDKARELLAPGWLCETAALRRAVGFEASTPLADGLTETAEWYRARRWL